MCSTKRGELTIRSWSVKPTWGISFEPSALGPFYCHKTTVARFFFFPMRVELQPLPLILTPLVFLWLEFPCWHLFILFWSNSFLWTWFWVSNWSFWNCGSFGSQFANESCLWYFLKSPWIKFDVTKSYMYIKHSKSWEFSSQCESCPK